MRGLVLRGIVAVWVTGCAASGQGGTASEAGVGRRKRTQHTAQHGRTLKLTGR
jgi:hypothetical protein